MNTYLHYPRTSSQWWEWSWIKHQIFFGMSKLENQLNDLALRQKVINARSGFICFCTCDAIWKPPLLCNIRVDLYEGKEQSVQAYRHSKSGHPEFQAFVFSLWTAPVTSKGPLVVGLQMVITTLKKFCWIVILLPADRYHQSENNPEQSGCYRHCVDENIERRNHYLDLAGIENYTSKFGPGNLCCNLVIFSFFCSMSGTVNCEAVWFVCSDSGIGLWILQDNYWWRWYHNRVANVLQGCFDVCVCVAKLGAEPRRTIFTSKLLSLVYGWGKGWLLDVGACSQVDTSTYFILTTDPKIGECVFIPGILALVPKLKRFGFPSFPCPLPGFYYSTHS